MIVCVAVLLVGFAGIYRQLQNQKAMDIRGTSNNTGSGYRDITYKGEKYHYNNLITSILYRKSFLSSAGYYILVVILIVCLAMMVKVNRSKRAERDDYKATLSQQETVEDLGNITITKPTDAPEDAVVRNTEDNAGEDGSEEGSDQTPAEDKTE